MKPTRACACNAMAARGVYHFGKTFACGETVTKRDLAEQNQRQLSVLFLPQVCVNAKPTTPRQL